jgi:formamidopyrimidine-DNA glycosylase
VPELPEVETVRAGVEKHVVGRTVATAEVLNPRAVRRDLAGPDGFAAAMAGRTFLRAERRGKYLWFALDDGGAQPSRISQEDLGAQAEPPSEALLAHLGMSGQLLVGDPDRPLSPHVRARFTFADGGADLRFTDQRTFGHLMTVPLVYPDDKSRVVPEPIKHIAPDPLEDVLTEALKAGGTSFDALYVNVNGESGYFDRSLNAYGREGEPCGRCATPIRRDSFMNRSSYSCPRCQK